MILGTTKRGTPNNLAADVVYVRQIAVPAPGKRLAAISALLDGQGPGAALGAATVYPVLYSEAGALLATGPGIVIAPGAAALWRTFALDVSGLALTGNPWIGLRPTGATNTARLFALTGTGAAAKTKAAPGGVAPANLTGAAASALDGNVFADAFDAWTVPDVTDAELARLPWDAAQRAFSATGPLAATRQAVTAGWHDTSTDLEAGANCIVRSDGPLADLVGERLRVAYRVGTLERAVYLYCHDEQAFPDEVADEAISLTKAAMTRLAPLSRDSIPVIVQVLA